MSLLIKRAYPDDWQTVREVRLAALQEAPYAFGSTYARERHYDEARWRQWLAAAHDERGCVFLAFVDGQPVGMDGAFVEEETGDAHLIAMWVAPGARRTGAGRALTSAVIEWSRQIGAPATVLDVAEDNTAAIALYEAMGFTRTGASAPLNSDPTRSTFGMRLENS